jgi:hypothetical protein
MRHQIRASLTLLAADSERAAGHEARLASADRTLDGAIRAIIDG